MPTKTNSWTRKTRHPRPFAEKLTFFAQRFSQIASIAVGYNNPHVAKAITSPEMVRAMVNRPALGNFPSTDMADILTSGLLKAAPPGLSSIFTASTGSDANETAYKAAFIWRRAVYMRATAWRREKMS